MKNNNLTNEWRQVNAYSGQWNSAKTSFVYEGRAVEIVVSPEDKRWIGQTKPVLRVLARGAWLDVPVPPLNQALPEYYGTYGPDDTKKAAQLSSALDWLVGYVLGWIASVEANL